MLTIQTKYQGEIEVHQEDILTFEQGLPGFVDETKFVILPFAEKSPFFILQSINTHALAFLVTEPFSFFKDYNFKLEDAVLRQLNIQSNQDLSIFVILTVNEPFSESTANLQAPIVLNVKERRGKQIILNDPRYETKHRLLKAAQREG
ncbi:flagellar assembly protein FliW [Pueribacillus theae]|uniref:Flagellar assembly factor FliW n=1 Tax=Pueribacillus theae TaxID=2171751 RepID=A0A2U1K5U8_9BACI|nr:flagellar assembly protein FliW [Pueribacillus theae]PWA12625.1 flagellar assembly protein FliW [Pueribacillus theae]